MQQSNISQHDLIVIMPVYNEEGCIEYVVKSWLKVLFKLQIDFHILILNDGSTDNTQSIIDKISNDNTTAITKKNSGHGPTILYGYKHAVARSNWVFQCDSDNEMSHNDFHKIWTQRKNYDVLLGKRMGRSQTPSRKFISKISRFVIRIIFGTGVTDVNVPYRLMKSDLLEKMLPLIPDRTFAPNIILSGLYQLFGAHIFQAEIEHRNRRTGEESIFRLKLWQASIKAFFQTLIISWRINR